MIRSVLLCLLSFVLLLPAFAQMCEPLNATFQATPQICRPLYFIPTEFAQNNTGGDLLSTTLSSLPSLPSHACAEAFSVFYCSFFYPECNTTDNTEQELCTSTCQDVVAACVDDVDKFSQSPLSLPTAETCESLSNSSCTSPPAIDLNEFYAECSIPINNETAYTDARIITQIICTPNYSVPINYSRIGSESYDSAFLIFDTYEKLSMHWQMATNESILDDWMWWCLKPFSSFYCGQYFPACNYDDKSSPALSICRSVCEDVVTNCYNVTQYFSADMLQLPSPQDCQTFPTTDCFVPTITDTSLVYFWDSEPPVPRLTSTTTSDNFYSSTSTTVVYPPGGPAAGGGIGAAVLVGLLIIIGILTIIMKRQDYR